MVLTKNTAAVLTVLLIAWCLATGCSSGGDSSDGIIPDSGSCQLSPSAVNFGIALLDNAVTCNGGGAGNQTITIQNVGATPLMETLAFTHSPGNPTSVGVFDVAGGQPTSFSVAPGGSLDVVLSSFACLSSADDGVYQGTADFGPACGNVSLTLTVVKQ